MNWLIKALSVLAAAALAAAACGGDQSRPQSADGDESATAEAEVLPITKADEGAAEDSSPRAAPAPVAGPDPAQTSLPHEPVVVVDDPTPVPSPTPDPVVVVDDPTPAPTPDPEPLVCGPVEVSGELRDSVPVDTDADGEPDDCIPGFDLDLTRPTPEPTPATSEPVVVEAETTVEDAGPVPESEWVQPPSYEDVECPEVPCVVGETASGDPVVRGVTTQAGPCRDELVEWRFSAEWLAQRRQAATEVRSEWTDREDQEGLQTAILLRGAELDAEFYEACLERQGGG